MLLALQQAGNITYSGWMMAFDCTAYTVGSQEQKEELRFREVMADQKVGLLRTRAKAMERALIKWEMEVEESRSRHYELNYYTTLQLLRIRKELSHIKQSPGRCVDPEILALLESISPKATTENVTAAMSTLEKKSFDHVSSSKLLDAQDIPASALDSKSIPMVLPEVLNSDQTHSRNHQQLSPSLCSSVYTRKYNDNPRLTESDLNENQKEMLSNLVGYNEYPKLLVLKAFEDCPETANEYDIQDWCDENVNTFNFDEEENKEPSVSGNESYASSSYASDNEDKGNVFNESAQKLLSGIGYIY